MSSKSNLKEIQEIRSLVDSIKGINLNENVNFEDFKEKEVVVDNCKDGECKNKEVEQTNNQQTQEIGKGILDEIRALTLKGMTELNKQSDSIEFQTLLKIFQICNKGFSKE